MGPFTSLLVVLLYVDMLNDSQMFEKVKDLITSPLGDLCKMPRILIELEALLKLNNYSSVIERCQAELREWSVFDTF